MSAESNSPLTTHQSPPPVWVVRHVPHEGLGTIADSLQRSNIPWTTIDAFAGPLPQFDPNSIAGLIVMGGPMNADEVDRFPFLGEEVRWLRQAVDAGLPVLGVCLGSQLLAKALGSRVYANRIKEIGWYEIELLPAAATDPLFQKIPQPTTVFQWHGDTFDLARRRRTTSPQPAVRKSSFSFRPARLWATISYRSHRRNHRRLAVPVRQLRRTGGTRLHRPRRHPPPNPRSSSRQCKSSAAKSSTALPLCCRSSTTHHSPLPLTTPPPCKSPLPPSVPIIPASPIPSSITSRAKARTSPRSRCTITTRPASSPCSAVSNSAAEQFAGSQAGHGSNRQAQGFVDPRLVARRAPHQTALGHLHHLSA